MQAAVSSGKARCSIRSGERLTEKKLQRDLAPNIAALRAEGLDTASIERLFEQLPSLLTATQETFASSLAALRRLAALLPDDPRAVQAPPGATQLGVALWLYPDAAARLLQRANLDSLIDGNLQLRRQLGISDAEGAKALFENLALVADFERAEAMVAHLQRLHASGALSSEHVAGLAQTAALSLTPAEFDRRWREGGLSQASVGAMKMIGMKDPAGRQRAAAEALGDLLQAADGMPGPLQQQYRQQGDLLVARNRQLWTTGAPALRAAWASLQHLGLSSSQVVALVQKQPAVLTYNWDGEAKRLLLAWVQQELGLSPQDFLASHAVNATYSVATLAMRADFLRQHRHALWAEVHSRGIGPLLSLLTDYRRLARAGCSKAELAAFNRAWLAMPAGRRWGGRTRRVHRRAAA
ncbi:hypothetical protein COHA_002932 [Chlorella ohadii]|uniref:Uncharacterized protein n=1 Tax=Chlorella ohadii TaxID=2649997 RepID=A0AAD5H404_9CHLO|nr:hypothetical protein COHA_002932 [Chlorella ohadii]